MLKRHTTEKLNLAVNNIIIVELSKETTASMRVVWNNEVNRQDAKVVILEAIGQGSDVSVKVANDILDEMDRLLIEETEEIINKVDKAL